MSIVVRGIALDASRPRIRCNRRAGAHVVQRELAAGSHGNHRRPAVDYLIAAIGEHAGRDAVTWFFDHDHRLICEQTGHRFEAESSTGPGH